VRPLQSIAYAILNDAEREVPPPVIDALHSYEVNPVSWSKRDAILAELTA